MGFKNDLNVISNAIKDRMAMRNMKKVLNKENSKDQDKERLVNSVTSEMINLFSMIEEKSKSSKIILEGCVFEPRPVNNRIAGTYQDPKVLAEALKLDPEFNRDFEMKSFTDDEGHEQYVIKKRKLNMNHI